MHADWISPWWQAALLPDRWDVCGVSVPPLSVWHVFALENLGNRYLYGGDRSRDDAASLLLFAERDRRGGRRLMHGRYYRRRAMIRMHRRLRKQEWPDIDAACLEYVESCRRHGTRMQSPGPGGSPAGTPEAWAIVVVLGLLGRQEEEAWNAPYAVGRALLDAYDERGGNATMTPFYGEEMLDHWDEYKNDTRMRDVVLN